MSDDPDIPYDTAIPCMAGKKIPRDNGTFTRSLKAGIDIRRRAGHMREHGDRRGPKREKPHDLGLRSWGSCVPSAGEGRGWG